MTELEKAARMREIKVCPYEFRCSVSNECYLCQWGGASKQIRFAANESFVLGAQWQAKQSPWISVEERLPDNQDIVLVKTDNGCFLTAYLHGKKSGFITYGEDAYKELGETTHWMEIAE